MNDINSSLHLTLCSVITTSEELYTPTNTLVWSCILFLGIGAILCNTINIFVFLRLRIRDAMTICLFALTISDELGLISTVSAVVPNVILSSRWAAHISRIVNLGHVRYWLLYSTLLWQNSSANITILIAFERCIVVATPLRAKSIISVSRVRITIVVIFIVATLGSVPHILTARFVQVHVPDLNITRIELSLTPSRRQVDFVLVLLNLVISTCVTFVLVVLTSVFVVVRLRRSTQFLQLASGCYNTSLGGHCPGIESPQMKERAPRISSDINNAGTNQDCPKDNNVFRPLGEITPYNLKGAVSSVISRSSSFRTFSHPTVTSLDTISFREENVENSIICTSSPYSVFTRNVVPAVKIRSKTAAEISEVQQYARHHNLVGYTVPDVSTAATVSTNISINESRATLHDLQPHISKTPTYVSTTKSTAHPQRHSRKPRPLQKWRPNLGGNSTTSRILRLTKMVVVSATVTCSVNLLTTGLCVWHLATPGMTFFGAKRDLFDQVAVVLQISYLFSMALNFCLYYRYNRKFRTALKTVFKQN